jgi:hypothetical protein
MIVFNLLGVLFVVPAFGIVLLFGKLLTGGWES